MRRYFRLLIHSARSDYGGIWDAHLCDSQEMSWWEALFLAILEGLTEFWPISSTGHLILASSFLGIAKEAFVQDFEIIIQGGAILAVVVHSFSRLWQPKLYLLVGLAFVPTAVLGYGLHDYVEAFLDKPLVVATCAHVGGGLCFC
jgi:undecaprenyl-diphosphatase